MSEIHIMAKLEKMAKQQLLDFFQDSLGREEERKIQMKIKCMERKSSSGVSDIPLGLWLGDQSPSHPLASLQKCEILCL
jgi:hypothetical protein